MPQKRILALNWKQATNEFQATACVQNSYAAIVLVVERNL